MAFKLIYVGNQPYGDYIPREFLCDTDADFENLPKSSVGSKAISIETGRVRMVNTEGEWVAFAEK